MAIYFKQGYIRLNGLIYFVEPQKETASKLKTFRKKRYSESLLHKRHKIYLSSIQYKDVTKNLIDIKGKLFYYLYFHFA